MTARNAAPRTDDARRCVKQLIESLGLKAADYRIADGCGLSLYNYVSPELLVRLLRYAYQSPAIRSRLLLSLPIAGTDGTLKNRMKGTPAEGNVRAKTGTVTGISSLAGYCTAPNGHELCFCIINQGVLRGSDGRQFQDSVCTALCE
jgi:D-alanyl-D-alanine carboxypeptidase/D-alanyl-D-alanine-endopeptidase (penicillin-binding protein 4)